VPITDLVVEHRSLLLAVVEHRSLLPAVVEHRSLLPAVVEHHSLPLAEPELLHSRRPGPELRRNLRKQELQHHNHLMPGPLYRCLPVLPAG
jgi:hypothetical protein